MSSDETADAETIRDDEGLTQQRRIESIFDLRDEIHQKRKRVEFEQHQTEMLTAYRVLVSSYLMELEPLLEQHPDGRELLHEHDFGMLTIQPDIRRPEAWTRNHVEMLIPGVGWMIVTTDDVPGEREYKLEGLTELYNLPNPPQINQPVEVMESEGRHTPVAKTVKYRKKLQLSMKQLDAMVRQMNKFLANVGFEVEIEDGDSVAQADYSDIEDVSFD